ncbi:MAG: NERD domain-containing protein [Clostridia bacterium]|nr:NERD domain-containing protein [Clostridia bacterium]
MFYPVLLAVAISICGFFSFPGPRGFLAELAARLVLMTLDKKKYIVMNDIYIPAYDGLYTQIDHLIVSNNGVVVVETKSFGGDISGSPREKYWKSSKGGHVKKVLNPIRQNSYHIKMLRQNCPGLGEGTIHSVVCLSFGANAEVGTRTPITTPMSLRKTVVDILGGEPGDGKTKDRMATSIGGIIIRSAGIRARHRELLRAREKKIRTGFCPRCGARLLYKRGSRGIYRICSRYPSCKFRMEKPHNKYTN